jgi:nucleoside 2-deoxyribosyltransferase
VDYDTDQARETFVEMVRLACTADVVVAYVPQASMGTAVEIWEAYVRGVPVYAISPLAENWVIKLSSKRVFPALAEFEAFLAQGGAVSVHAAHAAYPFAHDSAGAHHHHAGVIMPLPPNGPQSFSPLIPMTLLMLPCRTTD